MLHPKGCFINDPTINKKKQTKKTKQTEIYTLCDPQINQ